MKSKLYITGSWESADPNVIAPHFHVVNLFNIVCIVRMEDKSTRISSNQSSIKNWEMFLVGTLERFGNRFKLDSRLESDNRISSRFIAVERRHDLPSARSSLTESSLATNRSLLSPCSFFLLLVTFQQLHVFPLAQMYLCTLSLSIICEGA